MYVQCTLYHKRFDCTPPAKRANELSSLSMGSILKPEISKTIFLDSFFTIFLSAFLKEQSLIGFSFSSESEILHLRTFFVLKF